MAAPTERGASTSRARSSRTRSRASHSLDSVLAGAVEILDESGAQGLTIRALAARLGGGNASVYWYVSGRDELLDLAADSVLGGVLEATAHVGAGDPIDDLRTISVAMFDAIADRPWLGAYVLRQNATQIHSLRLYERIGEQVMRLGLTPRQTFHSTSAVVGYVTGTAADMGQAPPEAVVSGEVSREEYMADAAAKWRALDPDQFPYIRFIIDEFSGHDDRDQFIGGLDLLLAGLRLLAAR
jgi:AcrR family transcriptional regulator